MNFQQIINELQNTSSDWNEIERLVLKNSFLFQEDIIKHIHFTRDEQNDSLLELILLVAWQDGLNKKYSEILCELLHEDWHYSQEDIAMMLEDIKDENTVECLYTAAFKIPDFDDGRSLARKCIWALAAINTEEAKQKLYLLSIHEDLIISKVALQQL